MLPLGFTRAHAIAAGWSPAQVDAAVRSGAWTALRRGVYVLTAQLSEDSSAKHALDVAAAAAATTQDVVGSHESAALVHGLTTFAVFAGPPVLTRSRALGGERPDGATPAPLAAHVPAHHRVSVLGAPVTTIARTAVDLARKGPPLSAVVVLDSALRCGATRDELEEVLRVAKGWPGSRRAVAFVEFADARAESALESVGRWRMHEFGWPRPSLQVEVQDRHGLIGRTDFYFEDQRVIGEADGLLKYRDEWSRRPEATQVDPLVAEKLREDRLRDRGFEVFRFTWEMAVRRPRVMEERGVAAFRRAEERRRRAA